MFNNVGRIIKILAKVLFGVGVGLSIILWLTCLGVGAKEQSTSLVIISVFVLAFGLIGSWINMIFIYGFGVLVESSEKTAENTTPELEPEEPFDSFR